MKKLIMIVSLSVISAPLMVALVGVRPAMAADTQCSGTLTPGTYDNIVVPAGMHCEIVGATVNGNVTVLAGGSVRASSSQIGGDVRGRNVASVCAQDGTHIGGNFAVTGGQSATTTGVSGGSVGGSAVVVGNAGHTFISGVTVGGYILATGNTGSVEIGFNPVSRDIVIAANVIPVAYTGGGYGIPFPQQGSDQGGCGAPQALGLGAFPLAVPWNVLPNARLWALSNSGPGHKAVVQNDARAVLCFGNTQPFVGTGNFTTDARGQCSAVVP